MLRHFVFTKGAAFDDFEKKINKSKWYALANSVYDGLDSKYDFFIAGSDQIWNPYYSFVGSTELLVFASSKKKISYSASFGVDKIPGEKIEKYKAALSDFSYISVREDAGAKIIEDLTGKEAEVVLDPTLLLEAEDWRKIARRPKTCPKDRYTLLYFLDTTNKYTKKEEMENVFDIRMKKNGRELPIGPEEFIYLFDNAEKVITDSFHATVFSIIFRKPCITLTRPGIDMSSRISSLVKHLGIEECIEDDGSLVIDERIDYAIVDDRIKFEKNKAIDFLEKALCLKKACE